MHDIWIPLNTVANGGQEFIIDDVAVWTTPLTEFGIPYRIAKPLQGTIFLLPQEDGCLVRGKLTGSLVVSCDRCAEDATIDINHSFDSYEAFPMSAGDGNLADTFGDNAGEEDFGDADEAIRLAPEGKGFEIGLSALLWEELLLALPFKPLCKQDCKGLCPDCGKNLNEGPCQCTKEEGDPRMAVLRGLKLKK